MATTSLANPLQVVDTITGEWLKATYDTPLSDVPIFGVKSSLNPLGSFYRRRYHLDVPKEQMDKILPPSPTLGPPLPRLLGIKWPWHEG